VKPLMAPVVCGVAVAAFLYGLLWAAERPLPVSEDPWLDAWSGQGIKAEFRSTSTEPQNHLLAGDLRPLIDGPAYAGTVLRNYIAQNISVQVARLPKPDLLPEVAEGRTLEARFKPGGNAVHVCRVGRTILFISGMGKWIPLVGQLKISKKDAEQLFDAFEAAAKRQP
jgi:hypothetical protein